LVIIFIDIMKKITFLLFAVLLSLTAMAQDKTVVTPPAGLQTESWLLTAQRYDATEYTVDAVLSLNIGFVGQDVYVQGLNMYLPQTWVKGTLSNNQVTFAANQYYGELSDNEGTTYDTFFAGCDVSWFDGVMGLLPIDVTFTVNEAGDRWTTNTVLVVNTQTDGVAGFDYLKDVVIAKPIAGPATPMAPTIALFSPYDVKEGYGGLSLNFPPVDVEGNPLQTDKLSYIVYKDEEHQMGTLSFPAWNEDLQDFVDMTEIPYNFTDDYNIVAHGYAAYFYEPSASWNRIGVKAIYTGGDETRESEVSWMLLKPFADESTVFDFNAMSEEERPVSNNNTHKGDITENQQLTVDKVTLTISPCDGTTPNRYWLDYNLQAIQLRLYGGTLMFDVPDGYTMEKIYFFADNGYWNEYNTFDCGDFADGVWTGSAQHVVLTIDDGQPNTRLNSIAVIVKEPTGIITQKFATLANSWYTLQGTPLDAIPTQKGLYIHDGRVVVVK